MPVRLNIPKSDLRRETFRAGGKGGQHQNVTESAVRYTHLPTGISAESRTERSQHQNDQDAYALLCSKLLRLIESRRMADQDARYQAKSEAAFGGHHMRTYRDVGERDVVDHRSGLTGTFAAVVKRGKIDEFLAVSLRGRLASA